MSESFNILSRSSSLAENQNYLKQEQITMHSALANFSRQAGDISSLAAMSVGSFAFRFARLSFLEGASSLRLLQAAPRFTQGLAYTLALGTEVSAFRTVNHILNTPLTPTLSPGERVSGRTGEGGGIFDADGWRGTFTDFLALKAIGHLGAGQNLIVTHMAQSNAMVIGHELSARFGFTTHEEGSYLDRLVRAEITNIQMGAGMALMGMATGGRVQAYEQSLDAQLHAITHSQSSETSPSRWPLSPALAGAALLGNSYRLRDKETLGLISSHPFQKKDFPSFKPFEPPQITSIPSKTLPSSPEPEARKNRLYQQAFIVASATLSYAAFTPFLVDFITGSARWPHGEQVATMLAAMGVFSFVVVHGLIPVGASLQRSNDFTRRSLGKLATIGLETTASIALLESMGLIYGWDPLKVLKTAALMGSTQGFPLSTISRRWGKERPLFATVMRQLAMATIQTNVAVINALAAQEKRELRSSEIAKIAILNLSIAAVCALMPSPPSSKNRSSSN